MVTKLQKDMEGIESPLCTTWSHVKADSKRSLAEEVLEDVLVNKPIIEKASSPALVRCQRQSTTTIEGCFIGLEVTCAPPHAVVKVEDLIDEHFVRFDSAGYSNPPVSPGDRILKVDDMPVEHVTVKALHSMLAGRLHSPVKISLSKLSDGRSYDVKVLRHRYQAFQNESSPLAELQNSREPMKEIAVAPMRRASRAVPPQVRSAPPPPDTVSAQESTTNSSCYGEQEKLLQVAQATSNTTLLEGVAQVTNSKTPAGALLVAAPAFTLCICGALALMTA